jgi:histidinol-phosphatase
MMDTSTTDAELGGLSRGTVRELLVAAAEIAAHETLPLFRTAMSVDNKQARGFDPVTEADRRAEQVVRNLITSHFPDHGIIGEEWDDKQTDSPFRWIIDPIDGTRAFICGIPLWGTLIGLTVDGRAVAGLMSQPFTGETFIALPGEAYAARTGHYAALSTSGTTSLAAAKLMTTTPQLFREGSLRAAYDALERAVLLPRYGADCYAYCLLAAGHIDLVVEPGLKVVDIAPLVPIIREAGGVVTKFDGGPAEEGGDVVAAATPQLHAAALEVLKANGA